MTSPFGRGRILIVEDDDEIRASLQQTLEENGYFVETAGDGAEAWDNLLHASKPPRLILLDLRLPKLSGWALLERLRHSVILVNVPVIVVSAFLTSPPAGALAWFRKPVDPSALVGAVQRVLQS